MTGPRVDAARLPKRYAIPSRPWSLYVRVRFERITYWIGPESKPETWTAARTFAAELQRSTNHASH